MPGTPLIALKFIISFNSQNSTISNTVISVAKMKTIEEQRSQLAIPNSTQLMRSRNFL